MIIDCVSDLHGHFPLLDGGDLLLLGGDYTGRDSLQEWAKFFAWLKRQPYRKKILIAGNHDGFLFDAFPKTEKESVDLSEIQQMLREQDEEFEEPDFEYLCDSGTEFEGVKIWGSPWSLWFDGVNPLCKFFMGSESKLQKKFDRIPKDIDILLTHTPPYLIQDQNIRGRLCGSMMLRMELDTRVFPKFHFFGHIHERQGKKTILKRSVVDEERATRCFNVSYVNHMYKPTGSARRVTI